MKNFEQKVVAITGAASGIGKALAAELGKRGAHLALNDRDESGLLQTCDELRAQNISVVHSAFDVSDQGAMNGFADLTLSTYGKVDVMVNNAGLGLGNYAFEEYDLDLFEKIMRVNFYGVLYGSRAFVPHLLRQKEAALVNVSSVFGLAGIAQVTAYCASKFAVNGLNQCLIQEYRNSPLTVHSVHPGGINTGITRNSLDYGPAHDVFHQKFLKLSPGYAARVIVRGMEKKKNRILIGAEARQLDWITRLMPVKGMRLINAIIDRKRREAEAQSSTTNI